MSEYIEKGINTYLFLTHEIGYTTKVKVYSRKLKLKFNGNAREVWAYLKSVLPDKLKDDTHVCFSFKTKKGTSVTDTTYLKDTTKDFILNDFVKWCLL